MEGSGIEDTPGAAIPLAGTPTYRGSMVGFTDVEIYAGTLTMNADFAANTIGGNVTNIYDSAERNVSGSLVIAPSTIDRFVDPLFDAQIVTTMNGNLTDADGISLNVSGSVDGGFGGPSAEYLGLLASGTISSPFGVSSFDAVGLAKR